MSLSDQIAQKQSNLQRYVQELTGLTDAELSELVFSTAYRFLSEILETDEYGLEVIPQTRQFWSWWRAQWARLDQQYIDLYSRYEQHLSTQELKDYYIETHSATRDNYILDESLLQASFHQYIKSISTL